MDLTCALARTAVEVQKRFDQAYTEDQCLLGVPRQHLDSLTIETNVTFIQGKSTALSVAVKPVNIGFQVTHQMRESTFSHISLAVVQAPSQNTKK